MAKDPFSASWGHEKRFMGISRGEALLDLLRRLLSEGKITINEGREILRLSRIDAG